MATLYRDGWPPDWPGSGAAAEAPPLIVIGRVVGRQADDVCLVVDISATGASIQTRQPLHDDEAVTLEIGERVKLPSRVVRTAQGTVALEFERAFDPALLLGSALAPLDAVRAEVAACRRSSPRIRRCAPVELLYRCRLLDGELVNVTAGGVRIELAEAHPFHRGDRLEVRIEGMTEREATVRWARGRQIGVAFVFPLSLWKLDKWLVSELDKCCNCDAPECSAPSFERALARRRGG